MNSISLRTKLIFLCIGLIFISIVVGTVSYITNRKTLNTYHYIMEKDVPKIRALNRMLLDFRAARIEAMNIVIPGNPIEHQKESFESYLKNWNSYFENEKLFLSLNPPEKSIAIYKSLRSRVDEIKTELDEILKQHQNLINGTVAERSEIYNTVTNKIRSQGFAVRDSFKELIDTEVQDAEIHEAKADDLSRESTQISIGIILIGALIGILFGYFFSRKLSLVLSKVSNSMAVGSLQLNQSLQDLSKASQTLSSAATEQSAALQETAAAIEEISSMVTKSSESSKDSSQASENSKNEAQKGKAAVESMLESMNEIESSNQLMLAEIADSNNRIAEMMTLIQDIGNKTKVINDIVFQTKLLSFNASVEAARAGEHGKGFAVVATEIGNLAQMSGNAAKEITSLLDGSIKQVETIVQTTKGKVEKLNTQMKTVLKNGSNTAKDCAAVLENIVTQANSVSEMVKTIAFSSEEQAKGVQEISNALQEMTTVTNNNTSAANSTAQTVLELKQQADDLKNYSMDLKNLVEGTQSKSLNNVPNEQDLSSSSTDEEGFPNAA